MPAAKKTPVVAKSTRNTVGAKAAPRAPVAAATRTTVKPAATAVGTSSPPAPAQASMPFGRPQAKANKPAAEKPAKVKKPKLVRDSFTIPKTEYTVLGDLKQKAGKLSNPVKKSELLRAGIKALAAMPDAALLSALRAVPAIKTGRPPKG